MTLLEPIDLPAGFTYPRAFVRLVARRLTWFEPWWVMDAAMAVDRIKGMAERYPSRPLVPFAKREDNDDVACFEVGAGEKVFVIHDYATHGWERREVFDDVYAWLRRAVEDMIEFDRSED
jgi:hypothetical protein